MHIQAVLFRKNVRGNARDCHTGRDGRGCIYRCKQVREENIRAITEKLEEAFAENEEWLAVLGEAVYQYQKKTVRKMILKRSKNVRMVVQSHRFRPSGSRSRPDPESSWFCNVYPWTDTDLYHHHSGSVI